MRISARRCRLAAIAASVLLIGSFIAGAAMAEPRSGPSRLSCHTVSEQQCTAAPGGGGKLSNCHTVQVQECVVVSGPGAAQNRAY